MHTLWITQCAIQRVSLHEGLVLDFDDYNELVIATAMELTLPPVGPYPEEQVVIDPHNFAPQHRALLDMACLPPGQVRIVRHDLPVDDIDAAAS